MCLFAVIAPSPAAAVGAPSTAVRPVGISILQARLLPANVLADSWTWRDFWKFWKRQLDRTAGVVGVVLLVGAGAVLLILSKTRR
jgi:hypothetical protein